MKGPGDFVSLADKRAEKVLFEELAKARPGYGFVMEESGRVEGSDKSHTWHIDPLDATTNFLHAIPISRFRSRWSARARSSPALSTIPPSDEMYVSEKGQGAFGGAHRLRVAARRELSQALIGCGVPHLGKAAEHPRFKAELAAVMARVVNVRRMGCASLDLAYVAAGRFDAFWERGLHSWDIAAGALLDPRSGRLRFGRRRGGKFPRDRLDLLRQRDDAPRDSRRTAHRAMIAAAGSSRRSGRTNEKTCLDAGPRRHASMRADLGIRSIAQMPLLSSHPPRAARRLRMASSRKVARR